MAEPSLSFFVAGTAVTQGSKTAGVTNTGKRYVRENTGRDLKHWRSRVAEEAQKVAGDVLPFPKGPVALTLQFRLTPPKALPKWRRLPWGKPDALKLGRAVEDALKGVLYHDDGQVAHLSVTKVYALGVPIGVRVRLSSLEAVERDPDAALRLAAATRLAAAPEDVVVALALKAATSVPGRAEVAQGGLLAEAESSVCEHGSMACPECDAVTDEPEPTTVVDLMEALEASLAAIKAERKAES